MTKEDALLYFPLNEDIDINDLYDELLFQQKQFLFNRMPISKVFNSRIVRLKKIEEAYLFFGGTTNITTVKEIELIELDTIEEAYQFFQKTLTRIKLEMFNSNNITELLNAIDLLFKNQKAFALKIELPALEFDIQPIVSKEPDAMEIIQAIKNAKAQGISQFKELSQLPSENILIQEANRLSLWLKLETNV
jgi:hypothetical protein